MSIVRTGDLVIRVPKDGKRGSGPFYVDNADGRGYGGDPNQVAVSVLVYGPSAWHFGLPRDEVEVVGHHEVDRSQRRGFGFALDALEQMRPVIQEASRRFYVRFPAFTDGQTEVWLSEMTVAQWLGFIADSSSSIQAGSWDSPGSVPDQVVCAVPREGARTRIEFTARTGTFLLVPSEEGSSGHYVAIQKS